MINQTEPRYRLAYLTNVYPSVSHTFIRRELLELERRGHTILRLALRPPNVPPIDRADQLEYERTHHCLARPIWEIVSFSARTMLLRPVGFMRAACAALQMGLRAERGLVWHAAYLLEAAYLFQILRRHRIQHVHVHFGTNAATIARLIRKVGGISYSVTIHGSDEFDAPRALSLRAKVLDASFVAVISDFCSAQVRRWVPPEQWFKIHQVRCTVGDEVVGKRSPIAPESRTIVCVGRFSPAKGHILLVEALARLVSRGIDIRLVLAGDGELRGVVERRIAELRLGHCVIVTGWIDGDEVCRYISAARAVVVPSFAEGLPVVIMEAFALGRPVVATYVGGVPELVHPGDSGWLVPAGNVVALADALEEVMAASVDELGAMGANGLRRVTEQHYTPTEVARLEKLFGTVCARGLP